MDRAFYKVAMRPGKPLMAGRLGDAPRWSACPATRSRRMVCGHVFLAPMLRAMLGLPPRPGAARARPARRRPGRQRPARALHARAV
jgi:molybdopterin molybdotransferase